jgi:hypothetical protein
MPLCCGGLVAMILGELATAGAATIRVDMDAVADEQTKPLMLACCRKFKFNVRAPLFQDEAREKV